MKKIIIIFLFSAMIIILSFASWEIERWINWKMSYGPKIEQRIEKLEQRIEKLEESKVKVR